MNEVLARLRALHAGDLPTHGGRTLAYVYDSGVAEADQVGRQALALYSATNGLDPTVFPSLRQLENDLVGRALRMLHAPADAVGTVTSGGTESILLAVQVARDLRPDVERPSMVLPSTAHAAFHKAAHYFGVRPVVVDVDPVTFRADPGAMAAAYDDAAGGDTVLVVASAPSYAHGVVDPVPEIAQQASARGVCCHVDACIGGWVLPYLPDAPEFDFGIEGVTSVSVDLHKYAYTPKGASLLLFRSPALRRPQYFAYAGWPGYTMLNSTTQSTKSGAPLAAAWAVVEHLGDDGYRRLAGAAYDATREVVAGIGAIDGLTVLGSPDTTLVAAVADESFDVFTVADELAARGWYLQPQLSHGDQPPSLHLSISAATAGHTVELLAALAESVAAARRSGPVPVADELRSAAAGLDPERLDDAGFDALLALAGLEPGAGLPDRMAPVHAILDVAPPRLREALLVAFLDRLMRPRR
jgi:sphinganine-1-phosphate aldolase